MNMLIGVLCAVITSVAIEENESMMIELVNSKFGSIVQELDKNGDGTLSWDEFEKILSYPEALKALESVHVDAESMVDMAEDVFFEDGQPVNVTFDEFMEMVLDLRGGQPATVKDIMRSSKRNNQKFASITERVDVIHNTVAIMESKCVLLLKLHPPSAEL